ncbi:Protein prenyltransferase [Penicillium soppii]|jgi:hypothetical protein|uniref:Protein prenyltransferase n=1 Tax=Penicillium soppii TaxID=69789 RepID=UPI002546EE05|nr:Protein prenyltransferase [Penicillium soppii]KAJ5882119.1 Protein prenyltransferase [Penicillium soppii]
MSSPEHAFQELANIFASRDNKVLEIEIIPPSLGAAFLQDGCAIGTTKKTLIQAYTVARQLFFDRLQPMTEDDLKAIHQSDTVITEIMLLFDCEHLTACNWRKRRLCTAMASSVAATTLLLFQTELTLMSSYQCSPLHRHTKSPTLWHHRLWVLGHLLRMQTWSTPELLSLQRSELDVVLRAGELHPKNYYAFSYMRQLGVVLTDAAEDEDWNTESARSVVDRVIDWCLANPRDISGWSFAVHVLEDIPSEDIQVQALGKVTRFALSVGWEGESLWTFVAQAASQFGLEDTVNAIMIPLGRNVSAQGSQKRWHTWLGLARAYWAQNGNG